MFKKIILLCCITSFSMALPLEITSKSMKAVDERRQAHFIDDVKLIQEKSWLTCDLLVVHFDANKTAIAYEAIMNVKFEIHQKDSIYIGSAKKVIYDPIEEKFTLIGNAKIEDTTHKRKSEGQRIVVDLKSEELHRVKLSGTKKKPVKMFFDVGAKK